MDSIITDVEKNLEKESRELFENLKKALSKDSKNIDSDLPIKKIGEAFATHNKIPISKNVKNSILNYKLEDNIIEGKVTGNFNPTVFNEESFVNYFSGKELKEILFDSNLDEKKNKIETLTNLYGIIGGNSERIEKDKLINSLKKFYHLCKYPNIPNQLDHINDFDINKKAEEEANEIIELLGENQESISLNDFINMMTSDSHYDNIPNEDLQI